MWANEWWFTTSVKQVRVLSEKCWLPILGLPLCTIAVQTSPPSTGDGGCGTMTVSGVSQQVVNQLECYLRMAFVR